jgi:PPP family 3-phenylpropionic acid transporter
LYSSLSFGAGGAVGSFVSGLGWDTIGSANVYWLAALMALLAFFVTLLWIRPAQQQ